MKALLISLLAWTFKGPWWHIPAAYAWGYVVFVTVAISLWGFIYRPAATFGIHQPIEAGDPWAADDLVMFALMQGIAWPLMVPVYAVFIIIKSVAALLVKAAKLAVGAGSWVATNVSKVIPDKRPHGFQVKR